ncbi:hypothetical protein GGF46_003640 [Coemansia sp. RSA 552]|nr:hypothetical protein GGF46_003640 [Coemansia sp. RSA 552]
MLISSGSSVVDQAQPIAPKLAECVDKLVNKTAVLIEAWLNGDEIPTSTNALHPAYQAFAHGIPGHKDANAKRWLSGKTFARELDMYPSLQSFFCLVAYFVKDAVDHDHDLAKVCQLILPFTATNRKPGDASSNSQLDVSLAACKMSSPVAPQGDLNYRSIFAILEAKVIGNRSLIGAKSEANTQSWEYMRELNSKQPQRRFSWALATADTAVWASILTNDCVHESDMMNVATSEGRRELIRLVVGWSFCSWGQLGYDETLYWDNQIKCYVIELPLGNTGEYMTYYSDRVLVDADRLFGRRCQCLLASSTKPDGPVSEDNPLVPDIIIKDTWVTYTDHNAAIADTIAMNARTLAALIDSDALDATSIQQELTRLATQVTSISEQLATTPTPTLASEITEAVATIIREAVNNDAYIRARAKDDANAQFRASRFAANSDAGTVAAKAALEAPAHDAITAIVEAINAAADDLASRVQCVSEKSDTATVIASIAHAATNNVQTAGVFCNRKTIVAATVAAAAASVAAAVAAGASVADASRAVGDFAIIVAKTRASVGTKAAPFISRGYGKPQIGKMTIAATVATVATAALILKATESNDLANITDQFEGARTNGSLVLGWPRPGFDPYAQENSALLHNEFAMLARIHENLRGDGHLVGCYPEFQFGGWVYQPLDHLDKPADSLIRNGRILSSTDEMLGSMDSRNLHNTQYYAQMRVAIKHGGRKLHTAKSVGELICALCCAMRGYVAAHQKCNVFTHVSDNNIVICNVEGTTRGFFLDYGDAQHKTESFSLNNIANLEQLDFERTILDDWESLLYLICAIGSFGIRRERPAETIDGLPIMLWFDTTAGYAATAKRFLMDSPKYFCWYILDKFYGEPDDVKELADLAAMLHKKLFFNEGLKDKTSCRGTVPDEIEGGGYRTNPFKARAIHAQNISSDLLKVLEEAAAKHMAA